MARFYLNVFNRIGTAPDEEGVEVADALAAEAYAVEGIRSILSDEAKSGRLDLDGRIEITDENGAVVRTVPFGAAFDFLPGGDRAAGRSNGE